MKYSIEGEILTGIADAIREIQGLTCAVPKTSGIAAGDLSNEIWNMFPSMNDNSVTTVTVNINSDTTFNVFYTTYKNGKLIPANKVISGNGKLENVVKEAAVYVLTIDKLLTYNGIRGCGYYGYECVKFGDYRYLYTPYNTNTTGLYLCGWWRI